VPSGVRARGMAESAGGLPLVRVRRGISDSVRPPCARWGPRASSRAARDLRWPRHQRLDLFVQCGGSVISGGVLDQDLAQRGARLGERGARGAFLEMLLQGGAARRIEFAVVPRIEELGCFVAGHAYTIRRLIARVSWSRARARRDITVPTGAPVTRAISL